MNIVPASICLSVIIGLSYALPPFEIRSAGNRRSEGASEWLKHLQKVRACGQSTEKHPTFLCHSTKHLPEPECVYAEQLCDGVNDCPEAEDETQHVCQMLKQVESGKSGSSWGQN